MSDELIRSSPKSSHRNKKVTIAPKAAPRTSHPLSNLGRYAHKAKMPDGRKIGVGVKAKKPRVKSSKPKLKGY